MSFEGWKEYVFSNFVNINPIIKLDNTKEYSFVEMKDLEDGQRYAVPSSTRLVTGGSRFENRDTLFARITPCLENGKICQVKDLKNGVGFGSTEFLVFRGKKEVSNTDFIFYLSRWNEVRKFAEQNLIGTSGRQRVGREAFENLELLLPPLPIQCRIASILSSLDDKIELNRKTNQTLEAIAQALFKEWFVNFNFPGATGEMQDSELGEIPKGWRVGKVKELCDVNKSAISKSDFYQWIDYIEISEVNKGIIGNIERYKFGEEPSRAKRKIRHGDVVLSTVRPNRGSYFLAFEPHSTWIVSTGFAVFSATCAPFSFVYLFLTDKDQLEYYGHVADGGAYPAINPSLIMDLNLIIPTQNVLQKFHSIVEPFLERIHLNSEQTQTLTQLRDTLLPKLMKGEITIPESEQLTAAAL